MHRVSNFTATLFVHSGVVEQGYTGVVWALDQRDKVSAIERNY